MNVCIGSNWNVGRERLNVGLSPITCPSVGGREMLEWTGAGPGRRLMMLALHDDATREYADGPAAGLPASRVGTFTPALYEEAKKDGWTVISMKDDRKRIFAFE